MNRSRSHMEAFPDLNPFDLTGETVEIDGEEKTVRKVSSGGRVQFRDDTYAPLEEVID